MVPSSVTLVDVSPTEAGTISVWVTAMFPEPRPAPGPQQVPAQSVAVGQVTGQLVASRASRVPATGRIQKRSNHGEEGRPGAPLLPTGTPRTTPLSLTRAMSSSSSSPPPAYLLSLKKVWPKTLFESHSKETLQLCESDRRSWGVNWLQFFWEKL